MPMRKALTPDDTGSDLLSGVGSVVAPDHNILARANKSDAKGLATSAASASPMVTASANPFDRELTFVTYEGRRAVVNDACGSDGG